MQCFNDSGHKDATGGQHWNEKVGDVCSWMLIMARFQVSSILIGPGHQMMLFKPKGAGHSDWLGVSEWYVGDEFNDQVDSINIDY